MTKVQVTMRATIIVVIDFGDDKWEEDGARAIAVDSISLWPPGYDDVSLEVGRIEVTDVVELEEE